MTVTFDVVEGLVALSPVESVVTLDIETKALTVSADSISATIVTEGPQGSPANITAHEAAPNPHPQYATTQYVDARTPTISVGTTPPSSPAVNDIWVDTN